MKHNTNLYDVAVVGGGHAGIEAVTASIKQKLRTALITMDASSLGRMSCNPAVGGIAKGQVVREIDVLGGVMGRFADSAGIQFRLLNKSKGRSVWSPRAQVDKRRYEKLATKFLLSIQTLDIIEKEAVNLLIKNNTVTGLVFRGGETINASTVILTCGTFLNGLIHIGEQKIKAGRMGERRAAGITEALVSLGFRSGRLKTGTPPRLSRSSIQWKKTSAVYGDRHPVPFSYSTVKFSPKNIPCNHVKTNAECHGIIHQNLLRSPMFSGDVSGAGPRYCPSIEDKIHRFHQKDSHLLFLEPEWKNSDQIYVNGFSTSLPEKVQLEALRKIPALSSVKFLRPGYAIEYDFFPPAQLKSSLESKHVSGLFFAGQINGTSGYEEAAAQGLLAGVNASMFVLDKDPLVLTRSDGYMGVLIDDLITKNTMEPYRLFTSRAEFRLLLRYSNADYRLLEKSKKFGLISSGLYSSLREKLRLTKETIDSLNCSLSKEEVSSVLPQLNKKTPPKATPVKSLLKRPEVSIDSLPKRLFSSLMKTDLDPAWINEILIETETIIKYEGYINRQLKQIARLQKQEHIAIPGNLDYSSFSSLSSEAREKLQAVRPETLGQAMRISGVSPADAAALSVLIHK